MDISGGDKAPSEIIRGALLAVDELKEGVVLIGCRDEITRELTANGRIPSDFSIIDAPGKITMEDSPVSAVRKKKDSSIVVGINHLKEKKIDAFVSCGNTGAVVGAATLFLGLIKGVERPGIALTIPTHDGVSLVVDVGANIDCKPLHLLQYGIMASIYYDQVIGKENPSVGLLNIGEEASKGLGMLKKVHKLFDVSTLNFTGNLEARELTSGKCDCIVCDGFVGNIALKVLEGGAELFKTLFIASMKKGIIGKLSLLLAKKNLKEFKRYLDYAEYGGAPLLGVDGVVIIGHGRSNSLAVKNAIKVAVRELKRDVTSQINRKVNQICSDNRVKEVLSNFS
ncbi:MAG: phosphate acyltransferase PlsX [Candidatus Omnitrophica bacterium]|nr:phosphate acyltransferase PlsX [Candidatus Omnitrophota bacterium]